MRWNSKIIGTLFIIFSLIAFSSCNKDEFTEEDILKLEEEMRFTVFVQNPENSAPIAGAKVNIVQDGKEQTVETNENGIAEFNAIKKGDIPVTVSKADHMTVSRTIEYYQAYRSDNFIENVSLFPLTGPTSGTVKGRIKIETDLTNTSTEYAEGVTVRAVVYEQEQNYYWITNEIGIVSSTTDAQGNYSIKVPASVTGKKVRINLLFPDVQKDQKIYSDKDGDGPGIEELVTAKTVFRSTGPTATYLTYGGKNIPQESQSGFVWPNGSPLGTVSPYSEEGNSKYAPIYSGQIMLIDVDYGTGQVREIQ